MAHLTPPTPIHPGTLRLDQLDLFHNGVLLVDKPDKWTSFDVCGKIRNMLRFYGVKKVGHAGTLDPMATGLLIVCTGKGTKWADEFQAQSKVYSGTIRLGEATPSYDAESEVCERQPWEHITDAQIDAAAAAYVGDIMQLPPMFSAIKVQGQKLYELAREGQKIEVQPRPITINALRVWRQAPTDQELHFHVACSKGTYVRSMAHDLGLALGSVAHITALRREASGDHKADAAWRMQDLIAELNRVRDEHRAAQDRGAEASAEGPAAAAAEAAAATTAAAAAL